MLTLTQPLRADHKNLLTHIENLRQVADEFEKFPSLVLRERIDDLYRFLTRELMPHAEAEERVLYSAVRRILGFSQATAGMSHDHVEIERLVEELATLRLFISDKGLLPARVRDLRRVLYGLYTLIRVHFAKEEEIYFPLLDEKLNPEEAAQLFKEMEEATREAHFRLAS
jgi:iron-sulfur cluster repair protein YtfE (RIC family)